MSAGYIPEPSRRPADPDWAWNGLFWERHRRKCRQTVFPPGEGGTEFSLYVHGDRTYVQSFAPGLELATELADRLIDVVLLSEKTRTELLSNDCVPVPVQP